MRAAAVARGEPLQRPGGRIEAEDGGVLQVAGVQPPLPVERQPEREAAGARDQLDGGAVGGDAEDLALLAAAPDVAVARRSAIPSGWFRRGSLKRPSKKTVDRSMGITGAIVSSRRIGGAGVSAVEAGVDAQRDVPLQRLRDRAVRPSRPLRPA